MPDFPISTVVFDLDGTLVDSAPDLHAAVNQVLGGGLGRPPLPIEAIRGMVGQGARRLIEQALEATGGPAEPGLDAWTERFLDIYGADPARLTTVWPGVIDQLDRLARQGVKLAVCTNKPEAASHTLLKALGLAGYFGAVVGGDTLAVRKPDPAPLLAAIERVGGDPADAVLIGDSAHDVATARAAGVPVIAVSFGYCNMPPAELKADRLIDAFAELPGALAAIRAA
ncbi:phosphoglycolate phosphatase [Roseospirillum parvum]|uniref:Phosphoglycolate phosphatase n=1 Tax=Roseospirillum parvum TaxID=83401 RepID=A0A1G8CS60_9PROT|nr:phosphoglycolate phosphatase [Roseospirillum parvum]SDH47780.1 phosphoglycolate phosphatase [Roseospirillum parvum]